MKKSMNDQGLENLICGIVDQSIKDYKNLLLKNTAPNPTNNIKELESFFHSEYFSFLVNNKIDGDFVIKELREQCTMHNLDKLFKMFCISKRQVSDVLGVEERVLVRWIEKGEYEQERYEKIVKTLMKIIQSIVRDYDCR
jgi:hypothetical protein